MTYISTTKTGNISDTNNMKLKCIQIFKCIHTKLQNTRNPQPSTTASEMIFDVRKFAL